MIISWSERCNCSKCERHSVDLTGFVHCVNARGALWRARISGWQCRQALQHSNRAIAGCFQMQH